MADGFDLTDFMEQMRDQDSDSVTMTITRQPDPGRSISAEAMDQMVTVFRGFVAGRLLKAIETHPDGLSEVTMDLKLTLNGESRLVVGLEPWWTMVDGEHRRMQ